MKTRSKILVLLLALALICGILVVSTSAAETNPDGVTDYITLQTGNEVGTGEQRAGTLTAHTSDTGNAYFRHFYAKELKKEYNQYSFYGKVENYFENPDKFLTLEFDFSTETHFDSSATTNIVFLMRPGTKGWDTPGIHFAYSPVDGNYLRFGKDGEKIKLPNLQPYEWHHLTYVIELHPVVDTTTNAVTADNSRAILYLDGVKVAELQGNICPIEAKTLDEVRIQTVQSDVNRETGDVCIDNLVAKRVTNTYTGDLSAVMNGTANLGDYNGLFTWKAGYDLPTGNRKMAGIGTTSYTDAQAAIDAAKDGDTVYLYESIRKADALFVDKAITLVKINANLDLNYSTRGVAVSQLEDGKTHTFTKADTAANVTVKFGGETIETASYLPGETVSAVTPAVRTKNNLLYEVTKWKMTVDGIETAHTATITEEMSGKAVVYTAETYQRVAMTYIDANGKENYIPYTNDKTAVSTFLEFFNNGTTQTYKFTKNDTLRLECDIVTDKGITNTWKFGTHGEENCTLDLNGHDLHFRGKGSLFSEFRIQKNFYLISSRPGARVIADVGAREATLFSMWGGANVYVGGYKGADGNNLSFYNFRVAALGSNLLAINGGTFYATRGGNLFENQGGGRIELANAKIYLGTRSCCAVYMNPADPGAGKATTVVNNVFGNVEVYSASRSNTFASYTQNERTEAKFELNNTHIYGTDLIFTKKSASNSKAIQPTIDATCEFEFTSTLPALPDGYVYAHPENPERSFDGFVNPEGKQLIATGIANIKVRLENTAEIQWKVNGTVVFTDRWVIGATPYYVGTPIHIPFEQDPANPNNVMAPGDNWTIDGHPLSALTSEQAGTTLVADPEFVSTPKSFEVTTADGKTTYYVATDYDTLYQYVKSMTQAGKITLYRDYVLPMYQPLTFSKAGTELDLNGHTLSTDYKCGDGLIVAAADFYLYSSKAGAMVLTDHPYDSKGDIFVGGGFILGASKGVFTIGRTKDGTTFDRANLTFRGTCFLTLNANAVVDSVTYISTVADNWGLIQYWKDNLSVEVRNSDLWLTLNNKALFAPRVDKPKDGEVTGGWSATVDGCRIYSESSTFTTSNPASQGKNPPGATITNSILCFRQPIAYDVNFPIHLGAGVRMNQLNGFLPTDGVKIARTNGEKVTLNGNEFTILYETCNAGDAFTATIKGGDGTLASDTWKKGSKPSYRKDAVDTFYWIFEATEGITADTTYHAALRSTESKVKGNLTLYANITFNLYISKDELGYIAGIRYNGTEKFFDETDVFNDDGVLYYLFRIADIAPKDLSEAFTFDVIVRVGESETAYYTVKTSLVKYAKSVLANEFEDAEGKPLVMALLDYVRETSVALGGVSTESMGIKAIDNCLTHYGYTRTKWTKPENVITPAAGDIKGAALELLNTPGFVFFLKDTYADKTTVPVTVNGVTKNYEVRHIDVNGTAKYFFTVDNIHISNYRKDLTVKLGGQSFTYNFDVYMEGFTTVPAYAHALYAYSLAAEAYLAAQNNH